MSTPILPDWVQLTLADLEKLESLPNGPKFEDWEINEGVAARGPFAVEVRVNGKVTSTGVFYRLTFRNEGDTQIVEYGDSRARIHPVQGRVMLRDGKITARVRESNATLTFRPLVMTDSMNVELSREPRNMKDFVELLNKEWQIQ